MASGTISTTFSALFFGLSISAILSLIFGSSGSVEFNLTSLFENMTITGTESISVYWVVLLSWAIAGIVAGVRAKNSTVAGLAAFFAAFFAAITTALLFLGPNIVDQLIALDFAIDITPIIEPLPGFVIGSIGTIITCTLFGVGSGRVMHEPAKLKPVAKSRKVWANKDQWKCSKCGHQFSAGELRCPNCGEGVIQ